MKHSDYITLQDLTKMKEVNSNMMGLLQQMQEYMEENFGEFFTTIDCLNPKVNKHNLGIELVSIKGEVMLLYVPFSEIELGTWDYWLNMILPKWDFVKMPEKLMMFTNTVRVSRNDILFSKEFCEHVHQLILQNVASLPINSPEYEDLKKYLAKHPKKIDDMEVYFSTDDDNLDVMNVEINLYGKKSICVNSEIPYSFFMK